jgi:hypothetical protein
MDYIKKFTDQAGGSQGNNPQGQQPNPNQQTQQTGSGGGFLDKLHGMAGGGPESEKKEDTLDKGEFLLASDVIESNKPYHSKANTLSPGIDWVQENVFKQGDQSNESAAEQAKDRMIAQQIRDQYKNYSGGKEQK